MYFYSRKRDATSTRYYIYDTSRGSIGTVEARKLIAKKYGIAEESIYSIDSATSSHNGYNCTMYSFRAKTHTAVPAIKKAFKKASAYRTPNVLPKRPSEDDKNIYLTDLVADPIKVIEERSGGPLEGYAVYLDDAYDWEIIMDDQECLCLVAKRKK